MKIRMTLTFDVDAAAWALVNGLDDEDGKCTPAQVREDVRSFYLMVARSANMTEETNSTVEMTA